MGTSNYNPRNIIGFLKRIKNKFGYQYFYLISMGYLTLIGATQHMIALIQLPYYQAANVDAQTYAELAGISKIPWACKGFIGVLSDLFPLFGKHKKYYLVIYAILGMIFQAIMIFLPYGVVNRVPVIAASFLFGLNLCTAAHDLLLEAKNVQLTQKHPALKGDLIVFAWFFETIGELVPSVLVGIISSTIDVRWNFVIFYPYLFVPVTFVLLGGVIEDDIDPSTPGIFNKARFTKQWALIILATLQACFTVCTTIMTFVAGDITQLLFLVIVSLLLCLAAFILLEPIVAKFNLFTYLNYALFVNIQGALEYYYLASEDCAPDGPRFPLVVITTAGSTVFTIMHFLSLFIFQIYLYNFKFRDVLWVSTVFRMIASITDISIVNHWNKSIGIPDTFIYIFGYGAISSLCLFLDSLATIYTMAKLCPKKYESTMFAFLAGLYHFGGTTSYHLGVFLMNQTNIVTIPNPDLNIKCNWQNLNWLIIIAHMIMPLITLPLAFVLVPSAKLRDRLRDDYKNESTISTNNFKEISTTG